MPFNGNEVSTFYISNCMHLHVETFYMLHFNDFGWTNTLHVTAVDIWSGFQGKRRVESLACPGPGTMYIIILIIKIIFTQK